MAIQTRYTYYRAFRILRGVPTLTDRAPRLPVWMPFLLSAALIAADQALKTWALTNLVQGEPAQPFIPGLIGWVLTFNTGAAWSLFSGSALPLAIGRLLVGLGILAYLTGRPQSRFITVVLSLISAGAIGNAIDGIRLGKVTDMLYSPALSAVTRAVNAGDFPIFNLADIYVVSGTLFLLVASLVNDRKPKM